MVLTRAFSPTRPFLLDSLTITVDREIIAIYKPLTLLQENKKTHHGQDVQLLKQNKPINTNIH